MPALMEWFLIIGNSFLQFPSGEQFDSTMEHNDTILHFSYLPLKTSNFYVFLHIINLTYSTLTILQFSLSAKPLQSQTHPIAPNTVE